MDSIIESNPKDVDNPLVSVIIPTYKRSKLILPTLNCVLNQSYKNIEIIIVDDYSPDDTEEIINDFINKNNIENIIYIKHKKNKGAPAARNTGIKIAKGKYIQLLDDDDIIFPNKIKKQVEIMEKLKKKIGIIYGAYIVKDRKSNKIIKKFYPDMNKTGYIFDKILDSTVSALFTILFRKECFEKFGYFDLDFRSRQDMELCVRFSRHYEFYATNDITGVYYIHGNQISGNLNNRINGIITFIKKYYKDLIDHPKKFSNNLNFLGMQYLLNKNNKLAKSSFIFSVRYHFSLESLFLVIISHLIPNLFRNFYLNLKLNNLNKLKISNIVKIIKLNYKLLFPIKQEQLDFVYSI